MVPTLQGVYYCPAHCPIRCCPPHCDCCHCCPSLALPASWGCNHVPSSSRACAVSCCPLYHHCRCRCLQLFFIAGRSGGTIMLLHHCLANSLGSLHMRRNARIAGWLGSARKLVETTRNSSESATAVALLMMEQHCVPFGRIDGKMLFHAVEEEILLLIIPTRATLSHVRIR